MRMRIHGEGILLACHGLPDGCILHREGPDIFPQVGGDGINEREESVQVVRVDGGEGVEQGCGLEVHGSAGEEWGGGIFREGRG